MDVLYDDQIYECHCPSTGKIGDNDFSQVPCLLSPALQKKGSFRSTLFTVEAISFDPIDSPEKKWTGINQNASNRYVEYFIMNGMMNEMVKDGETVKRETKLYDSRIDFLVGESTFVEVKTPLERFFHVKTLEEILNEDKPNPKEMRKSAQFFERTIKHLNALANLLEFAPLSTNPKAILLFCFMYDAKPWNLPRSNRYDPNQHGIITAARRANKAGVERWQVNLKIDHTGVEMIKYFKLNLLHDS